MGHQPVLSQRTQRAEKYLQAGQFEQKIEAASTVFKRLKAKQADKTLSPVSRNTQKDW